MNQPLEDESNIHWALDYIKHSWYIFPVRGKRPLTKHGYHDASIDFDKIQAWWLLWPDAGIGLALKQSGLCIVDVDNKTVNGFLVFNQLKLPETLHSRTINGGEHHFFRLPEGVLGRRIISWRPGIDLLSDGYVVIPPTEGYKFDQSFDMNDVVDLPEDLVVDITNVPSQKSALASPVKQYPQASQKLLQYIEGIIYKMGPAIEGQGGDEHTYRVCAVVLNDFALSPKEAIPILEKWNASCKPPWSKNALLKKMVNAVNYSSVPYGQAQDLYTVKFDKKIQQPESKQSLEELKIYLRHKANWLKKLGVYSGLYVKDSQVILSVLNNTKTDAIDYFDIFRILCRYSPLGTSDELLFQLLPEIENLNIIRESVTRPEFDDFKLDNKQSSATFHKPFRTRSNVEIALHRLDISIEFCMFRNTVLLNGIPIDDNSSHVYRFRIEERFDLKISDKAWDDFIKAIAKNRPIHPVCDYLDSLTWDGVARVDTWLSHYMGAKDVSYSRIIGSKWLLAAVKRVRDPGCKFDQMLILEGNQGIGKSKALRALAIHNPWFTDSLDLSAREHQQVACLQGRWIIEASEMQGISRADQASLRKFLSRSNDKTRLAYERHVKDYPRQCVIAGTTNDKQYLSDTTGNRRYWPIWCTKVNYEALVKDVDQIWAEASQRVANGESIEVDSENFSMLSDAQEARYHPDDFEITLSEILVEKSGRLLCSDVKRILGFDEKAPNIVEHYRITNAMQRLGWERKRLRRDGALQYTWSKEANHSPYKDLYLSGGKISGWKLKGVEE